MLSSRFLSLKPASSPYLNRFVQPDTIIPDLSNPQAWNRYSYVINRPVNFNDPTGHVMTQGCGDDGKSNCAADPTTNEESRNLQHLGKLKNDAYKRLCNAGKEEYCSGIEKLSPDYVTLNIAAPFIIPGIGPDIQFTRDYYGQWYVAGGIYTGLRGVSLFGGNILQEGRPSQEQMERFITGDSYSMGGGSVFGGGVTWGQVDTGPDGVTPDDFAVEAGLTQPGFVGTWTYGVKDEEAVKIVVGAYNYVKGIFGF